MRAGQPAGRQVQRWAGCNGASPCGPAGRRVMAPLWRVLLACGCLFRDHLVFDLVVRRLRHNLLRYELVLGLVGPTVDDLQRVGGPDNGQGFELFPDGRREFAIKDCNGYLLAFSEPVCMPASQPDLRVEESPK
jgi:hypothetical protein